MPFWACLVNSAHEVFFGEQLESSSVKGGGGHPVGLRETGFGVGQAHAATGRARFETRFGRAVIRRCIDCKRSTFQEGWGDIGAFMGGHMTLAIQNRFSGGPGYLGRRAGRGKAAFGFWADGDHVLII